MKLKWQREGRTMSLIAPEEPDGETLPVRVLKVFDGDGFLASINIPARRQSVEIAVRMGFIDAPEMQQPGGKEAQAFLSNVISGRVLDLTILTKLDVGSSFDRHGRVVAIPYLREPVATRSGLPLTGRTLSRNIELEVVLNGWAWVLDRYDPDPAYYEALADAQRHRRGIWARDDNVHPWDFKLAQRRAKAKKASQHRAPDLFEPGGHASPCEEPGCTGHLIQKQGRFGRFLGCSAFPTCRFSRRIDQ